MRYKCKKYTAAAVTMFLLFMLTAVTALAADGSITYGSGSYSPSQGEEFQVGVYVKGSEAIGAYEFYLDYNADMLEYVSGADSGGSGRLKFVGYGNASTYNYMLTFRAKTAGTCTISISNAYLGPFDPNSGDSMNITSAGSAQVSIQGPSSASGECRLAELSVSPTGLWGFSPDKTEYDITVDNDVSKLAITAKAESEKASVVISDTNLAEGVNTITIKVTAENGTVKNYTIIVRRKAAEAETQTTTAVSDPEIDNLSISFLVNGKDMYFSENIDSITAPEGFQKTTVTYKGEDVPAFTSLTQNITLFYLQDGLKENGAFYVYNSQEDSVYPYIRLTNSQGSYMLISADSSVEVPEGYVATTLSLANGGEENIATTVTAWVYGSNTEFFLVYALNGNGEMGFYQYDSTEKTLQRYNGMKAAQNPEDQEAVPPGSSGDDAQKIAELESSIVKLKLSGQNEAKNRLMIIIALSVLSVALIIAVIGLILKLKGQVEDAMELEDKEDYESEEESPVTENTRVKQTRSKVSLEKADVLLEQAASAMEQVQKPEEARPAKEEAPAPEREELQEERKEEKEPEDKKKQEEKPEDDFLLDLDDDDFTFFDYDDK